MRRKQYLFLLMASGIFALMFPLPAFSWWNVEEILLDPSRAFIDLPDEWDKTHISGGPWPRYGAQPKTAEEVRQEKIMTTVRAAHQLTNQNNHAEALAKLRELDSISGKTREDVYIIERTRLTIALRMDDKALQQQVAQGLVAAGGVSADEQLALEDLLARTYYNQKNYTQAIPWLVRYLKEGGTDPALREALIRAHYLNNDYSEAAALARGNIEADEKSGKAPDENLFDLWLGAVSRLNDRAQYGVALEKTISYYPKKEYWAELLSRIVSKPTFSESLSFDVYRFMYATGQISGAEDYLGMAQAALQAGYAGQAKRVLEQGFQAGLLGRGPQAGMHRNLLGLASGNAAAQAKRLARDAAAAVHSKTGEKLVVIGERYIDQGEADRGIGLMVQGIRAGNLKNPNEAKLHLGIAYAMANRIQDALQTWRQVQGNNGSAELARYWRLYLEGRDRKNTASRTQGSAPAGNVPKL